MMLLAVVVTFMTMIVRIRRARRMTVDREPRIDGGHGSVDPGVPDQRRKRTSENPRRRAARQAVSRVGFRSTLAFRNRSDNRLQVLAALMSVLSRRQAVRATCRTAVLPESGNSATAFSVWKYASRKPRGDVSAALSGRASRIVRKELFRINCLPCHGDGTGPGPVAPLFEGVPANLPAPRVRALHGRRDI